MRLRAMRSHAALAPAPCALCAFAPYTLTCPRALCAFALCARAQRSLLRLVRFVLLHLARFVPSRLVRLRAMCSCSALVPAPCAPVLLHLARLRARTFCAPSRYALLRSARPCTLCPYVFGTSHASVPCALSAFALCAFALRSILRLVRFVRLHIARLRALALCALRAMRSCAAFAPAPCAPCAFAPCTLTCPRALALFATLCVIASTALIAGGAHPQCFPLGVRPW